MVILFNGYPATILRRSYTLPILFLYCSCTVRSVFVWLPLWVLASNVGKPFENRLETVRDPLGDRRGMVVGL